MFLYLYGSQFIDEFLSSEEGKTIINICSTRYLFKQSPGSVDEVVNFFNLSDRNKKYFNNGKSRRMYFEFK